MYGKVRKLTFDGVLHRVRDGLYLWKIARPNENHHFGTQRRRNGIGQASEFVRRFAFSHEKRSLVEIQIEVEHFYRTRSSTADLASNELLLQGSSLRDVNSVPQGR